MLPRLRLGQAVFTRLAGVYGAWVLDQVESCKLWILAVLEIVPSRRRAMRTR